MNVPIQVLHILPHRGGGAESYIDLLERMPGFVHRRFYLSAGRTPASGLLSIPVRWPPLAAQARAADLLHCHGDMAGTLALPLLHRRPSVITCQGLHMLRRVEGARRLIMTRAVRRIAASVEAVICSSTSERDDLIPLVRPRDQAKLRLLYNGLDLPGERSLGERHAAREQLGVAVEDVVGLFVGRLEERKAPLLAAAAARRVRSEGIPFVLLVAGEGPLANALQAEAGPHMRLLGHQQEMGRIYAAADVFLQPSEREGMSFALLEAMAHGVPAVAADGPGNPEAVGDTGIVFPAGDEVGLAEALTRLSRDGRWRAELGAAARVRVGEQFTVDRFLRDSAAVYSEALPPSPHA